MTVLLGVSMRLGMMAPEPSVSPCYHVTVFNFGKPKTVGDWIVHIAGVVVALFLVWWMLRVFVL
jgi:pyocin large subunit-like protein